MAVAQPAQASPEQGAAQNVRRLTRGGEQQKASKGSKTHALLGLHTGACSLATQSRTCVPLEVVHQRPVVEATHVGAVSDSTQRLPAAAATSTQHAIQLKSYQGAATLPPPGPAPHHVAQGAIILVANSEGSTQPYDGTCTAPKRLLVHVLEAPHGRRGQTRCDSLAHS